MTANAGWMDKLQDVELSYVLARYSRGQSNGRHPQPRKMKGVRERRNRASREVVSDSKRPHCGQVVQHNVHKADELLLADREKSRL
jgi:hypothetical protein